MSKIRHIALLANDPAALAAFYQKTFGMREVPGDGDGNAIFISDGYINLALIPARGRPEGIFHFGFEVENLEETANVAVAGGATPPKRVPQDGRFNEAFIKDPVGTRVDLSEAGWKMA
jgi:catechol 2,3-dioxygenase-like lactoylglutathione lyase family enzyme